MNWLNRVWSKIWVEQSQPSSKDKVGGGYKFRQSDAASISNEDLNPYFIEGEDFQFLLSHEWRPKAAKDEGQTAFYHEGLDMDFVFSVQSIEIPESKLETMAKGFAEIKSAAIDNFKRELGLYPVGVQDEITEQSWGYQVSIIRTYVDHEFYRSFVLVSPSLTLTITFEGQMTVDRKFDLEIETVMAGLRFSDSFWGDRDFPEGTKLQ